MSGGCMRTWKCLSFAHMTDTKCIGSMVRKLMRPLLACKCMHIEIAKILRTQAFLHLELQQLSKLLAVKLWS
eukprot:1145349-Pelagomonas_calceolata.AAC.12